MTAGAGLSVISGGQAPRDSRYLVASEAMIIATVGLYQLFEPKGISLNRLHKTLDRVREGRPRIDWYALRDTLGYLENDGRLKSHRVRAARMPAYQLYQLADWEEWWRLQSRLMG